MEKLTCSIIKDILPLYIDGAVSCESAETIKKHLTTCTSCHREYASMSKNITLPVSQFLANENAHTLKSFRRNQKRKKMVIVCISVFITLLVLSVSSALYQNVGIIHDFFSPSIHVTLRNIDPSSGWQRIRFGESEFLEFDSVFYSKEVVNDGNSSGAVFLRISDVSGNIVLNETEIMPGASLPLDILKNKTSYTVEIKSEADFIHLNFC